MLNQTNIGFNNNKYYVIQIVETDDGSYHLWTRWGRVGEPGANQHQQFSSVDDAVKAFKKKFHDKTRNKFEERHKFVAHPGKYTIIEIEGEDEEQPCASTKIVETDDGSYRLWTRWGRVGEPGANQHQQFSSVDDAVKAFKKKFHDKTRNKFEERHKFVAHPGKYTIIEIEGEDEEQPCASTKAIETVKVDSAVEAPQILDSKTAALVKFIFDVDMFSEALTTMEIDINKMPLGKLSKSQIVKGFTVLEKIESVLNNESRGDLTELSSQFYTIIPHAFGRRRPPTINTAEALRSKLDLLITLGDVEMALNLLKESDSKSEISVNRVDSKYATLQCDLTPLVKGDHELKLIEIYFKKTMANNLTLQNVWKVNRHYESDRFAVNDSIKERKLLWHGTNVAVVAAILKSGLRIMPHSVGPSKNIGIMFLNEVVLGKEYTITSDDSSLRKAPDGYNSVVARGRTEPDPAFDTVLKLDNKDVIVPQGVAVTTEFKDSSFWQSEYLIYNEHQCRIRYLLQVRF
uniref:Poly [ADP-ribose] polymerase n=1 Tax=Ascaris lumbricoides TaxID=6252 RepID=A0A9J2QBA2_ASCLU